MSEENAQPQAVETPKANYTNVSGRLQAAPDGSDWPDLTTRDLTDTEANSYVAYGYAIRTPEAPQPRQPDTSRPTRAKGGEAQ